MKLIWVVCYIIVLIAIIVISWNIHIKEFSETFPVIITVSNDRQLGVDLTDNERILDFGTVFPGVKVQKSMILARGKEPPARINISTNGDIKNWSYVDKNNFILDKPTDVNITFSIPNDIEDGTYSGNVTISYISTSGIIFDNLLENRKRE